MSRVWLRKASLPVAIGFLCFAIILFLLKNSIGDIRPALLPSSKDIGKTIEEQAATPAKPGEPVSLPLKLPAGFTIGIFAKNLGNARDIAFSQGGTLLVSTPASGKVIALPDKNNDGRADEIHDILTNLNKPHGIAFHNGKLFVAQETQVIRYLWDEQSLKATKDKVLFPLPKSSGHSTRTIAFDKKGHMFISIGSTCNVCVEKNGWFASVIVSDENGNKQSLHSDESNPRIWAKGLRNAVFIVVNSSTDELWGTEMGRDFLGDNLPPDEINIIRDGKDYGWPICYGDRVYDTNFGHHDPSYCDNTEAPIYKIAAHSAPLGLVFINSSQFPKEWQGDLFVAYHGSWNRSTPSGYKVVRMKVNRNTVTNEEDFLTGFLVGSEALGRPVNLAFDQQGSLYISDDKAGSIFKITHAN